MKKVIIKLNKIVKLLSFEGFPNKQELYQAFEDLKKIFNSPTSPEASVMVFSYPINVFKTAMPSSGVLKVN